MKNHSYCFLSKSFLLLSLLFITSSLAEDVCCVLAKITKDQVNILSMPASSSSCAKGAKLYEDYQVCNAMKDPSNACASISMEEKCKSCGYFWNGSCLTADPVEKAKEQLKKEEEEKKKKAEQEKSE